MKRITSVAILAAVLALIPCCVSKDRPVPSGENSTPSEKRDFSEEQKNLLELHNEERKSRGYAELEMDEELCAYAQEHARKMAEKNSLFHSSMSDLSDIKKSGLVGENIAWGQETAAEAVSGWMWSPMHRWNILGSNFKKVGFGAVKDKDGRYYWCTVFSD